MCWLSYGRIPRQYNSGVQAASKWWELVKLFLLQKELLEFCPVVGWSPLYSWLTQGKWMGPDRFLITGEWDRGVIIMPNKCHDTSIRWRVETQRLVSPGKLLSHYSVPSLSQACQSELPNTPHTNYGLCFLPSGASISPLWPLCILLSVPGHWWWSMFLMLKAGQRVYKIYESK